MRKGGFCRKEAGMGVIVSASEVLLDADVMAGIEEGNGEIGVVVV